MLSSLVEGGSCVLKAEGDRGAARARPHHIQPQRPGEANDEDIQAGSWVGGEWADALMASECGAQEGNGSINPHWA